jgi:hypothetical protein
MAAELKGQPSFRPSAHFDELKEIHEKFSRRKNLISVS